MIPVIANGENVFAAALVLVALFVVIGPVLVRALAMVLALPLLARKVVAVASHLQAKKRPLAFKGRPAVVLDAVRPCPFGFESAIQNASPVYSLFSNKI